MKKISHFLGAAALVTAASLAVPAQAQAATGFARCPAGSFCVFTGTGGSGVMASFTYADGNLSDGTGPQGMNDNIESVYNNTGGRYWGAAANPGYGGAFEIYGPGFKGRPKAALFNEISSVCRTAGAGTTCT